MTRIAFCIATLLAVTSALANSPMLVDGAGHTIGYYIGPVECPNGIAVLSRLNYLACIRTYNEPAAVIDTAIYLPGTSTTASGSMFAATNCGGTPYATANQGGFVVETLQGLMVANVSAQPISFTAVSSNDTYNGSLSGYSSCTNLTTTYPTTGVVLLPFSQIATGLNPAPYVLPLYVMALPDSAIDDDIMFDTFDAGY